LNCTHNLPASGVIEEDICRADSQAHYINVTCMLDFKGSIAPSLVWSLEGPDNFQSIHYGNDIAHDVHNVGVNFTRVTSTLDIQGTKGMNGARLVCSGKLINSTLTSSRQLNITRMFPVIVISCTYLICLIFSTSCFINCVAY